MTLEILRVLLGDCDADAPSAARKVGASINERLADRLDGFRSYRFAQFEPGTGHAANASGGGQVVQGPLQRSARHAGLRRCHGETDSFI